VLSRRPQRDAFISFRLANIRPCLPCPTQARLNILLQEPSGLTISCDDVALRSPEISLLFPSAFPALHKNFPFRDSPRQRGNEDRKNDLRECPPCISQLSNLLSKQAFISAFCQVITEASSTVPQLQLLTSNTSTWHPVEDFTKSRQAQAVWQARLLS
jgi:hypothetical protein